MKENEMCVFFIAEAGVNHNGKVQTALDLIDVAAGAGADAVKFQTFKADETVKSGTKTASYQKLNTNEENQHTLLKRLELSEADHILLAQHCKKKNIEFMSTAFDVASSTFLNSVGIQRIKVPSGEITNLPFLEHLAATNLPIILSTGMATLSEIKEAVNTIKVIRKKSKFLEPFEEMCSILHCTSAYPTPPNQLNLKAITTLKQNFTCPIGYSDHSDGINASFIAIALGATIYEKHFTLDSNMIGPDHKASLEPDQLKQMIDNVREASQMLGNGEKIPQLCELEARNLVRRSLYASQDLKKGSKITIEDITILRPSDGLEPKYFHQLIGNTISRDISSGEPFKVLDL